jgi:hypothetical protein
MRWIHVNYTPTGVQFCEDDMMLHLVSLVPGGTPINTREKGISEVKTKSRLLGSSIL